MVGFWRKIESKDKGKGRYGAGQPYPFENELLEWTKEMNIPENIERIDANASEQSFSVRHVCPVWEQLQHGGGDGDYKSFFQGF